MSDKLNAHQVAAELGYHPNHVYRLLAQGKIKGTKWVNTWIIDRAEVDRIRALQSIHGQADWEGVKDG